ncbi:MAG: hypothetical protein AUJ75_02845 [Candidatus Omnitrophica bacterium CG1_02_49_10]|nr:MAG: hypothetical protein AUJ75_02845 [Candidatus Omnitrophica bacterium CG1_02_49_10]
MNDKKGVAILFAMLIMILLSIAVGVSIFLARATSRLTGKVTARKASSYVAEAAIQEVIWKLHNIKYLTAGARSWSISGTSLGFTSSDFDDASDINDGAKSGMYTAWIDINGDALIDEGELVEVTIGAVGTGTNPAAAGTRPLAAKVIY